MDPPKKKFKGETPNETQIPIMGPSKTLNDCELELKGRRAKYEHLNLFSPYEIKLHSRALFSGYQQSQTNRHHKDYFTLEDLDDEYNISLVEYAIAEHNKEAEDNAKLAFEDLIFVDTCNYPSHLVLRNFSSEYYFFFGARNLSNGVLGGYYTEVRATYPDEHIHVENFCCLSNGKKDGSVSSSEKGKQSDESSMGMNSNPNEDGSVSCEKRKQSHDSFIGTNLDSIGLLSDRISNPILITSPSKNTEGKTLKDCELELKARRSNYEQLDLFSEYHLKLHIQALYNGYWKDQLGHDCLGINFTLEELDNEYHNVLVRFAIAKHNRKCEDDAKLALKELLFFDTDKSESFVEYHFFFVACNISNDELGGYYAEVKAVIDTDEIIQAQYFCRLRYPIECESWPSCEKGKQSNEMGMNSDSIGILSDRIPTPIEIEDQPGRPKKTMDKKTKKKMKDRIDEYNERQNHYDNLDFLSDFQKSRNIGCLICGYRQRRKLKYCIRNGKTYQFGRQGINSGFTLEDLDDEFHTVLVEYAIAKHNEKVVDDNDKLALEKLLYFNTSIVWGSRRYGFSFVATKGSHGELGGYFAEVRAIFPDEHIVVKCLFPLRAPKENGRRSSCKQEKQSDVLCSVSLGVAEPIEHV